MATGRPADQVAVVDALVNAGQPLCVLQRIPPAPPWALRLGAGAPTVSAPGPCRAGDGCTTAEVAHSATASRRDSPLAMWKVWWKEGCG